MKSKVIWALVLVNAALLLAFVGRVARPNAAIAQPAPPERRPGDFLTIPMEVTGASSGIVVVVDQTNGQLSAVSYDDANRRFDSMNRDKVDLQRVFEGANRGR